MLTATALLVYLVMPNQLMTPAGGSAAAVSGAVAPGAVLSDLAHTGCGQPVCLSDDVTMPPRNTLQEHAPLGDRNVDWVTSTVPVHLTQVAPPGRPMATGAGDALRPTLSHLQILRC
ncbi:hypothetical protein ACFWPQ_51515 [Streptomyces sp. NPDC058464]|uniref:hypothetical protein n=1 Tax=Streptomyces sp. NPDC058464 TaxID=3346511 RepID=UPI00364D54D1